MDLMSAAMGSLSLASANEMTQYSMALAKKSMDAETQSAAQLLEMLPQQPFQVRGPQPGDTPAVLKGSFFDTYA
ncbi:MAG: YjfB family protein [Oscillospiraceae bacterium]|nr:YjfB family protein [Oscillospiraceae bacterium]